MTSPLRPSHLLPPSSGRSSGRGPAIFLVALLLVGAASGLLRSPAAEAQEGAEIHPHYQGLLRQGSYALEREDAVSAERDLRLACFGMLESPPALTDCLARLALAQAALDDQEGFEVSFRRLVELEERFGTIEGGALSTDLARRLAEQVGARISKTVLEETGGGALLAAAGTDERPTERPPGERSPTPPSGEPTTAVEATSAQPTPARPGALGTADQARLERGRAALGSIGNRSELQRVLDEVTQVADRHLDHREAQHLAAALAYRASLWAEAVKYFRRGGDPGEDRPELLFYFAVSLYETGDRSAAARALERSLPRLEKTAFVESYRQKILGGAAGNP